MKICSSCGEQKPASEFYKRKISPDGLHYKCRDCAKAFSVAWRAANREKHRAYSKRWTQENRERVNAKCREWRERNKEKRSEVCRTWNARNQDKRAEAVARRRARIHTPEWANKAEIARFYKVAKELEKTTGQKHHVDHIVPLNSPLVCGLHVESNLQVIPASTNVLKRNLFWPDMP